MSTNKKVSFSRVYVLANGSRHAHNAANQCNVDPLNFQHLTNVNLIKHLENSLFLISDSFSKNKNKELIETEISKLKEKTVLTIDEFKLNVSYEKQENFKKLKRLKV